MSVEAIACVKRHAFGSVSAKAVMLVLADYSDAQWSCFVGQHRLAWEAEVSLSTVQRLLKNFEAAGLVERDKRYGGMRGRTSDRTRLVREAIEHLPVMVTDRSDDDADLHVTSADLHVTDDVSTRQALTREPSENRQVEPLPGQALTDRSPSVPVEVAKGPDGAGFLRFRPRSLASLPAPEAVELDDLPPGKRLRHIDGQWVPNEDNDE